MSSKKLELSDIARRIIAISSSYATDKAFLKECDISNLSFVTDVRKGRANSPGADKLAKIVRGTGCSGTWLLTGEGEKYPPEPRQNQAAEPRADYMADFMQAQRLIASIEQKPDAVKDDVQIDDLVAECSQLITRLIDIRRSGSKK